ncbi:MAG: hypothetical protein ACR2F2_10975 [Pyrinomonadaceae bacterium]
MNFYFKSLKEYFIAAFVLTLLFSTSVFSQNYPDKIRGYKVYQTKISIRTEIEKYPERTDAEAIVKIGEPELTDISLTGITLEVSAEIEGIEQNGKIDFVSFKDIKVNGLDVEIEEYREPFELKKNKKVVLPKPVKAFISSGQTLRGAFRELKESKNEWTISGKVFIFGKFKKFGFNFKRVIPLDINFKIENPIKKKLDQIDK